MRWWMMVGCVGLMSGPAVAAPVNVVDYACKRDAMTACAKANSNQIWPEPKHYEPVMEACEARSEAKCVTTIDVPTTNDVRQMFEAMAKEQRTQWADWLKTLEATGVVQPVKKGD